MSLKEEQEKLTERVRECDGGGVLRLGELNQGGHISDNCGEKEK